MRPSLTRRLLIDYTRLCMCYVRGNSVAIDILRAAELWKRVHAHCARPTTRILVLTWPRCVPHNTACGMAYVRRSAAGGNDDAVRVLLRDTEGAVAAATARRQ